MKLLFSVLFFVLAGFSSSFAEEGKKSNTIKPTKEQKFNNWTYRCFEDKNKKETCGIFYDVIAEDKENKKKFHALSMRIYKDPVANKKVVTMIAPINLHLPSGVKFDIDGVEYKKIPFLTCVANPLSCNATAELTKELDKKLKKSKKISISYRPILSNKILTIDLDTKGYSKAIKKI